MDHDELKCGDAMQNESPQPIGEIIAELLPKYLAAPIVTSNNEQLATTALLLASAKAVVANGKTRVR